VPGLGATPSVLLGRGGCQGLSNRTRAAATGSVLRPASAAIPRNPQLGIVVVVISSRGFPVRDDRGIDLAGETFREEAELADERLFGQKLGQK
jgi:hypothetical protein